MLVFLLGGVIGIGMYNLLNSNDSNESDSSYSKTKNKDSKSETNYNKNKESEKKEQSSTEINTENKEQESKMEDEPVMTTYTNSDFPNFSFQYDDSLELTEVVDNTINKISLAMEGQEPSLEFSVTTGGIGGGGVICYDSNLISKVNESWVRLNDQQSKSEYIKLGEGAALKGSSNFDELKKTGAEVSNLDSSLDPEFCKVNTSEILQIEALNSSNNGNLYVYIDANSNELDETNPVVKKFDEVIETLKY